MMNWIENLKENDIVVVSDNYNSWIEKVKRITKTQILTNFGRFNKSTLYLVGNNTNRFYFCTISEATPEKIAQIKINNEQKRILKLISEFNFKKLNIEYLFKIEDILKQIDNG